MCNLSKEKKLISRNQSKALNVADVPQPALTLRVIIEYISYSLPQTSKLKE